MANDVSARPWFVDTVGTLWPYSQVYVKFIEWVKPQNIGDEFELTDINGKSIVRSSAQVANDIQTFNLENWFNGVVLSALDSGTLRIHVK